MTYTDTNTSQQERNEVAAWIAENGYANLEAWMKDSDYLLIRDAYWVDLDDNIVDPWAQAYFAMEAEQEALEAEKGTQ